VENQNPPRLSHSTSENRNSLWLNHGSGKSNPPRLSHSSENQNSPRLNHSSENQNSPRLHYYGLV
jgi:hypothetical protein